MQKKKSIFYRLIIEKLVSGLFKFIHWPICRLYAKHILGDRPSDPIFRSLCSLQFWRVHRYWPNFVEPHNFSEKLWNRMLNERDSIFTLISDKLRVRDYMANKVGSEYLVPILWSGEDPNNIPFDELPLKFVIKTNHGCKYNIIVKDKTQLDYIKIKWQLKKWLSENYGQDKFLGIAWGYRNIRPCIMIESFIEENGKAPVDYKFYCFSGRVEVLTLHLDRFEGYKTRAFNRNFEVYEFGPDFKQYNGKCKRPRNFKAMVQLAETLSEGFDFMRVDLYSVENQIYFSELTPYPGGVSSILGFDVASMDYVLGEKWKEK